MTLPIARQDSSERWPVVCWVSSVLASTSTFRNRRNEFLFPCIRDTVQEERRIEKKGASNHQRPSQLLLFLLALFRCNRSNSNDSDQVVVLVFVWGPISKPNTSLQSFCNKLNLNVNSLFVKNSAKKWLRSDRSKSADALPSRSIGRHTGAANQ